MKKFIVVKHFPELVFNPNKNVFSYTFNTKREALLFIEEIKNKDKPNSIDFLTPDSPKHSETMQWRIEEMWDGYFEYSIIQINIEDDV
jgi:hypothetical protein